MALKEALEARLRAASRSGGQDQNRLRMRLVMDRFAARVAAEYGDDVVLKGGVVLELRLAEARATKDLDLHLVGNPDLTLVRLQRAGRLALDDHLAFELQPDARHPTIEAEGMQYEGLRFRVQARLAGKVFGGPFGLDTVPRSRPNSWVKDLPDIALLAMVRPIEAEVLLSAIMRTFSHRAIHPVPAAMPDPPAAWLEPYARMAQRDQLPWQSINRLTEAVRDFLEPDPPGV